MLPTTEKKLNTAMRHLMALEGALVSVAALVAYARDGEENLHLDAAQANNVGKFVERLARQAGRIHRLVFDAAHPEPPTQPAAQEQ